MGRKRTTATPPHGDGLKQRAEHASVRESFESWRARGDSQHWGLAWFLANEFCERFYSSHGIAPHTIDHDGLGYYGIQLTALPCAINGPDMKRLGRLTMFGDVEDWQTGGPGDHGLEAIQLCESGVSTDDIVEAAVQRMKIPAAPEHSHARCRHKRHGASYELMFYSVDVGE